MRLLLVEDTDALAQSVQRFLRAEGHAVDHAPDMAMAAEAMALSDYACVILDLGLPDGSGLDLLRSRRQTGDRTPILIATARDQISDRIAGLDAGADDYVVKPFDLRELSARIRAHARGKGYQRHAWRWQGWKWIAPPRESGKMASMIGQAGAFCAAPPKAR